MALRLDFDLVGQLVESTAALKAVRKAYNLIDLLEFE
jgi:hypothetical protein